MGLVGNSPQQGWNPVPLPKWKRTGRVLTTGLPANSLKMPLSKYFISWEMPAWKHRLLSWRNPTPPLSLLPKKKREREKLGIVTICTQHLIPSTEWKTSLSSFCASWYLPSPGGPAFFYCVSCILAGVFCLHTYVDYSSFSFFTPYGTNSVLCLFFQ